MSFTALPVELKQMICDYVMVECGEVVHLDFAGVLPQEGSDVDEDLGASDGLSIIGEPYASSKSIREAKETELALTAIPISRNRISSG